MKRVFSLFLCLLCVCAVTAQIRGNEIRVVVSPDHSDWVYRLNEKCTFTVRVLKAQNLLSDVKIDYELGPEMYPTEVKKDVVLKDGTLKLQGTMKTAGFLRCKVKAHVDGRTYEGLATCAYAPAAATCDETSCRFSGLLGQDLGRGAQDSVESPYDAASRTLYGNG